MPGPAEQRAPLWGIVDGEGDAVGSVPVVGVLEGLTLIGVGDAYLTQQWGSDVDTEQLVVVLVCPNRVDGVPSNADPQAFADQMLVDRAGVGIVVEEQVAPLPHEGGPLDHYRVPVDESLAPQLDHLIVGFHAEVGRRVDTGSATGNLDRVLTR